MYITKSLHSSESINAPTPSSKPILAQLSNVPYIRLLLSWTSVCVGVYLLLVAIGVLNEIPNFSNREWWQVLISAIIITFGLILMIASYSEYLQITQDQILYQKKILCFVSELRTFNRWELIQVRCIEAGIESRALTRSIFKFTNVYDIAKLERERNCEMHGESKTVHSKSASKLSKEHPRSQLLLRLNFIIYMEDIKKGLAKGQDYYLVTDSLQSNLTNLPFVRSAVSHAHQIIKLRKNPESCFLSMRMLKQIVVTGNQDIIIIVEDLLPSLSSIALIRKELSEDKRGQFIFGSGNDKFRQYSTSFIQMLLESISKWAQWTKKKQVHPQFYSTQQSLIKQGVVFPKKFIYYSKSDQQKFDKEYKVQFFYTDDESQSMNQSRTIGQDSQQLLRQFYNQLKEDPDKNQNKKLLNLITKMQNHLASQRGRTIAEPNQIIKIQELIKNWQLLKSKKMDYDKFYIASKEKSIRHLSLTNQTVQFKKLKAQVPQKVRQINIQNRKQEALAASRVSSARQDAQTDKLKQYLAENQKLRKQLRQSLQNLKTSEQRMDQMKKNYNRLLQQSVRSTGNQSEQMQLLRNELSLSKRQKGQLEQQINQLKRQVSSLRLKNQFSQRDRLQIQNRYTKSFKEQSDQNILLNNTILALQLSNKQLINSLSKSQDQSSLTHSREKQFLEELQASRKQMSQLRESHRRLEYELKIHKESLRELRETKDQLQRSNEFYKRQTQQLKIKNDDLQLSKSKLLASIKFLNQKKQYLQLDRKNKLQESSYLLAEIQRLKLNQSRPCYESRQQILNSPVPKEIEWPHSSVFTSIWLSSQFRELGLDQKQRFRKALLKEKQLLFKDSIIQIGTISNSLDSEQLQIDLYITNHGLKSLDNFTLQLRQMGLQATLSQSSQLKILQGQQKKVAIKIQRKKTEVGSIAVLISFKEQQSHKEIIVFLPVCLIRFLNRSSSVDSTKTLPFYSQQNIRADTKIFNSETLKRYLKAVETQQKFICFFCDRFRDSQNWMKAELTTSSIKVWSEDRCLGNELSKLLAFVLGK